MPWNANTSIDDSVTRFSTGEGFIKIAEGNYLLQLDKVGTSEEDRDGDPFFSFALKIEDGPDGHGKTIRYTGMVTAAKEDGSGGAWALGRVLHFLGADPKKLVGAKFPTYGHFVAYAAALEKALLASGPRGKVGAEVSDNQRVNNRTGKVEIISNITGFFPATEWDLRKQSNAPAPLAQTRTAPVAAATSTSNGATAESFPAPSPAPTNGADEEKDLEALVNSMFPAS